MREPTMRADAGVYGRRRILRLEAAPIVRTAAATALVAAATSATCSARAEAAGLARVVGLDGLIGGAGRSPFIESNGMSYRATEDALTGATGAQFRCL
jgi:hypothetical protein